jgi:hypothetical protein
MSFRWAFNCNEWEPTETELAQALASIQQEEQDRICRFMFLRDVKLALVGK